MKFIEKYKRKFKNGKLFYRNGVVDSDKDYLQRHKYYFGLYSSDMCGIETDGKIKASSYTFTVLKQYALGKQSVKDITDKLNPMIDGRRLPIKYNITPTPIFPKYMDIMVTNLATMSLEKSIKAIDEKSKWLKNIKYAEAKYDMLEGQGQNQIAKTAGDPTTLDLLKDDIELLLEAYLKDVIDTEIATSSFEATRSELEKDLVRFNTFAYDLYTKSYIDPGKFGIRYSDYADGRDVDFKFYVKRVKVADLPQNVISDRGKINQIENAYRQSYNVEDTTTVNSLEKFGEGEVEVMVLEFRESSDRSFVEGRRSDGTLIFDETKPGSKVRSSRKKITKIKTQYLYRSNWIIGTDVTYDSKRLDTVRTGTEGNREALFNIISHVGKEPSILERVIPHIDDANFSIMKKRQLIASMPPGIGMFIDASKVKKSVKVGGRDMGIADTMKMFGLTGLAVIETKGDYDMPGRPMMPGQNNKVDPFFKVDMDFTPQYNLLMADINQALNLIKMESGFNDLTDGSGVPADMLKHNAEAMSRATNSAFQPHIRAYKLLFENLMQVICKKEMLLIKKGSVTLKSIGGFGSFDVKELSKQVNDAKIDIRVKLYPKDTIQMLEQTLMEQKQAIPAEAYMLIWDKLRDGDIQMAQILLARYIKEAQEAAHQKQMELVQAQSQGATESAKVAGQLKKEEINAQKEADIEKMEREYALKEAERADVHTKEIDKMKKETKVKTDKDITTIKETAAANKAK